MNFSCQRNFQIDFVLLHATPQCLLMSIEKQSQNITQKHGANIDEGGRGKEKKNFPTLKSFL